MNRLLRVVVYFTIKREKSSVLMTYYSFEKLLYEEGDNHTGSKDKLYQTDRFVQFFFYDFFPIDDRVKFNFKSWWDCVIDVINLTIYTLDYY